MNTKLLIPIDSRPSQLDIGNLSDFRDYDVTGLYQVCIQCANNSGVAWGTGRIGVVFTNIGELWCNLPDGAITPYSTEKLQQAITLNGLVRKMRVYTSTANASAANIQLCVLGIPTP